MVTYGAQLERALWVVFLVQADGVPAGNVLKRSSFNTREEVLVGLQCSFNGRVIKDSEKLIIFQFFDMVGGKKAPSERFAVAELVTVKCTLGFSECRELLTNLDAWRNELGHDETRDFPIKF